MIEKLLQLCVLIVLLIVVTVVMSACLFASVTPSSTDNPLTPQTSGTSLPVLPTASTDEPAAELRQLSPMPSRPTKTPTSTPVADSTLQQQALPRYGILYYLRDRQVWTGFGAPDDWRLAKLPVEEGVARYLTKDLRSK